MPVHKFQILNLANSRHYCAAAASHRSGSCVHAHDTLHRHLVNLLDQDICFVVCVFCFWTAGVCRYLVWLYRVVIGDVVRNDWIYVWLVQIFQRTCLVELTHKPLGKSRNK